MEPLNILGRFSLSLSFRLKLLDLLLHSRHLLFPAIVDFGSPTRTLCIRFGFALMHSSGSKQLISWTSSNAENALHSWNSYAASAPLHLRPSHRQTLNSGKRP
ncbi:Hypothetical protein PHPALM_4597 [Phytophthora palmivora]|uniref:Uncharacterized protein n=1 Tax=Phytophthora palmivora TaxID=4796 RepID=A0A2P4YJG1_9STRA|nr:Hypothetical protein PHPALM_4597 [Phytophthora palmivora]